MTFMTLPCISMTLEEEAIALLLRSPRLEVGTIIDLLDVSDAAFRQMVENNPRIAALLEERRAGSAAAAQRGAGPVSGVRGLVSAVRVGAVLFGRVPRHRAARGAATGAPLPLLIDRSAP